MIVIPSLEILGGQVVAPEEGDAVLAADPIVAARALRDDGALFFHLVDLDAIRGTGDNLEVVRRFVDAGLSCQVAGGIRDLARAERLAEAGVDRLVVGSILHARPDDARELALRLGTRAMAALDVGGGTAGVAGGARRPWSEAADAVRELGFSRVLVRATEGTTPCRGPQVDSLRATLGREGLEVHANVLVAGRDELRELKPLIEQGLAGVVIAAACRVLEVEAPAR